MADRWDSAAPLYATSEHRAGTDLDALIEVASGSGTEVALDIATGAGHTAIALAPHVARVIATDRSEAMLAQTRELASSRGVTNVEARWADAHELPFPAATFDIVTCRIAPHHFDDLDPSLREVARVLKPGGRYVLEDSVAPDDADAARFLHEVEVARDSTHLRTLTAGQWVAALERAGLSVEHSESFRKRRGFESWLARGDCDEAGADAVRARFGTAPAAAIEALEIERQDGTTVAFTDDKILLLARRA
ncbi:MAG: Methyltransferase type 11 [Acidimicrobiales bacterium]|jgi:ubiquinone/menaquinone biosynthesis C-methylase UbiE|nr:Methyltransferase type 11 [Acidimicrobiales bacterium]